MNATEYKSSNENAASDREAFIERNMPLVGFVTARFLGRGYEYEDLYQYGCIGLIKAVDRFDQNYGVAFSTYAVPLIIGEIKRFLRGDGSVHVSRTIKENSIKVIKAIETSQTDGSEPTLEQICKITGLEKHEVVIAMSAMNPVRSLYESVSGEGDILLQDVIGKDDGERVTDNIAISQALDKLDDAERSLIVRRYFERHTQTSIALDMGMTQVQISRMEKKVLHKLKDILF